MNAADRTCKRCGRGFVQRPRRQGRRQRYCGVPCRTQAATLLKWQRRNGLAPAPVIKPRQCKPGDAVWNDRLGCEVVYPDGTPYARESMGYTPRASPQLMAFMAEFPEFDPDTGERINEGFYEVDLRRGWYAPPEDRRQDRELERLERERFAEALSRMPDEVREKVAAWLSDD